MRGSFIVGRCHDSRLLHSLDADRDCWIHCIWCNGVASMTDLTPEEQIDLMVEVVSDDSVSARTRIDTVRYSALLIRKLEHGLILAEQSDLKTIRTEARRALNGIFAPTRARIGRWFLRRFYS